MLKTKTIFFLLYCVLILCFLCAFFTISYLQLELLLSKQYEQKIKSLDDVLRFSLLKELDEKSVHELAQYTRADFWIQTRDQILSSLIDLNDIHSIEKGKITSLNSKKIFAQSFMYDDIKYMIIVYPKFSDLNAFWWFLGIIFISFIAFFLFLIFFIERKLNKSFKIILEFLDKIDDKSSIYLPKSLFQEFNILHQKLYKTKEKILKKALKNKKQHNKIALKNAQLKNVISAISHELKNPLSVIDLSIEILKEPNQDENLKQELLDKISRQSKKLDFLTKKLNSVFNPTTLHLQEFDLFELGKKIIKNPGFERVILQGQNTKIKADIFLIEQVIINLLSNALKYSQKEVILHIKDQELCVQDFGKGIALDQIKLITKKFYKIDEKSENSLGIGLFLVKKILSIHKTYLQIQSNAQGSIFGFKFHS
ncbi:sensor histidine kinase [Campylobacter sp. MIT 99-7217]|uniref:sensor histidine kinase n=1 Tax=Campylobacter sp. MIT 99-7217 TaxID=535091 RepID=UPI00115B227B|nr:HAMP domain-containing sensor histidine kinase [Campylobacter sp. MIT 99-7217]TQR34600.1 sensor histidine kinase [Campylobacter sp. MIT 99-7217]